MTKRLSFTLLLFCLALAIDSPAQPAKADRDAFDQIKAKADKGDPEAQLELGALYASGVGVAKDPAKAAKWHRKAAEQGVARAQYQLAWYYSNGEGVKLDKAEAAQWYRKAAVQGMAEAQLALGLAFLNGDGVRASGVEAVRWFRLALAQGLVDAEYEMGKCYFDGTGVTKNIEEGVKLTRRAAERGFGPAQKSLGECYQRAVGVDKDYVEAYKWLDLAAAQDDLQADDIKVSLAGIEAFMTKEQVAQAQHLAHEFKPSQNPVPEGSVPQNRVSNPRPTAPDPKGVGDSASPAEGAKIGFVNVTAEDGSCEIFADGAFVGNSPAKLKLAEGPHVVEVKKTGFKDYRKDIQVGAGSDLTLRVVLEKQ